MEEPVRRALTFLRSEQQQDGSFTGYTSPSAIPFKATRPYRTVFTPALILGALASIPEAAAIRGPLAAWLVGQRSDDWTFNYWAREAAERSTMPYPDDLDDTFCALSSLYCHDKALISAGALGDIVQILIAAETAVGGPYRTWLADRKAAAIWQDTDLAVNANVAYFLRLVAEPLPNLVAYMDDAIGRGSFTSPYYPDTLPVLYFISRAYTGNHTNELAAAIKRQQPGSPLGYALQSMALLRLGDHQAASAMRAILLKSQQQDGGWPAAAFCLDPAQAGKPFYQGARALTTAFAIEALTYDTLQPANTGTANSSTRPAGYGRIVKTAAAPFAHLQPDLRHACAKLIHTMADGDKSHEIIYLPQIFAASLTSKATISETALRTLSHANLYGWMAYTVFDDIMDNEGGHASLPAAAASLRASFAAFQAAVPDEDFQRIVQSTFDRIDSANAWEIAHCRATATDSDITIATLPHYGALQVLAGRSLGHTLTPLGILALTGHTPDSPGWILLRESLCQYLIARQLQDDMHDWEADLRRGQLNVVATAILKHMGIQPGTHSLAALVPRMQSMFWEHTVASMSERSTGLVQAARHAALKSCLITPESPFMALYGRLDGIIAHTRASQADALAFLESYKKAK